MAVVINLSHYNTIHGIGFPEKQDHIFWKKIIIKMSNCNYKKILCFDKLTMVFKYIIEQKCCATIFF